MRLLSPSLTLLSVPFPRDTIQGGAGVLTAHSQCPFKAFATARLGARGWDPAEAGLTAAQRGQLLHAVLHAVWGGPPPGLRSRDELLALTDRKAFVDRHVRTVLREKMPASTRERMPQRYLELEEMRLSRLVTEWLDYEATRLPFTVAETEVGRSVTIAGLNLRLRLDRIDRLNDDSLLVIDYKSGNVSPKAWDLPRPDDVQLPLYAGFALDSEEKLGGLVFAKVRAGEREFAGSVGESRRNPLCGPQGHRRAGQEQTHLCAARRLEALHRAARPRFSRRPRDSRSPRLSQDLRALRPASALPRSGARQLQ